MTTQDDAFFLLSKLAWGLLSPGNIIIIAVILGVFFLVLNKEVIARRILIPTALFSFIIMIYPVSDYLMAPLEHRFKAPKSLPTDMDAIIVLGGGEDLQRSLSWNRAELGNGGDRYIGAADLASLYPDIPVIFTGGNGTLRLQESNKEAHLAQQLLTSVGIEEKRIIIESDSRNTYENFINLKQLLPKVRHDVSYGRYFLVTSAYHMPRSVGIARKQGIDVVPYPVDYYSNSDELRYFTLDLSQHLKVLEKAWREWLGLTAYYYYDKTDEWFPAPDTENN